MALQRAEADGDEESDEDAVLFCSSARSGPLHYRGVRRVLRSSRPDDPNPIPVLARRRKYSNGSSEATAWVCGALKICSV